MTGFCENDGVCGIAGYKTALPADPGIVARMITALRHRGPDSLGFHHSTGFSAGACRLAINDPAHGDQPLFNEDRSIALLYNGEIYNYRALRRELEERGCRFRTDCDGEVICHLYAEHGEDLFERLDGMFAAALWIERERKLVLARDIPGEKPLYYAHVPDSGLAFASEIKGLLAFPGIDTTLDPQALWDFPTFLWVPEPRTIYRSIEALPPSHLLVADGTGIRVRPYRKRFASDIASHDDHAIVEETRRVVVDSVRSRLLSDVPIGSFLSSGLDSSIVAAIASGELPRLDTFTIGFEDGEDPYHGAMSEGPAAAAYARHLGTRHHTIKATANSFRELLPDFCRHGDQPFSVSSGLGILAVARAAREAGVKVLLSGDGADESFGGYAWYTRLGQMRVHSAAATAPVEEPDISLQTAARGHDPWPAISSLPDPERARALHYYASEGDKRRLYNRDYFEHAHVRSSTEHFRSFKSGPWTAEDYIAQDRAFYLPNEMLRKVDRMTMAQSVEGRLPFAAPAVLDLASRLSYRHLVRDGTLKWSLRQAFAHLLPEDVVKRPKHGFNVPIDQWLRSEWKDLLDATFSPSSALSKAGLLGSTSREVAIGMISDPSRLHGHTLFSYVMLDRWLAR